MSAAPVRDYVFNPHALLEMAHRGLNEGTIRGILDKPEQRSEVRPGRDVVQSQVRMGTPERSYLVRVFVDVDRTPAEVVTAYRTSRIAKYWREEK